MSFKDILAVNLNIKNSELFPAGYQHIGNICIISLNKKLNKYKKQIGKIILKNFKFKSVLNRKSGIKGQKRLPLMEIIAGSRKTETIHNEAGIKYKLDPRKVMFSKGNMNERHRIAKLIRKDELIVDMFAGIGYFTIPMAKENKAKMIYACEINPISYKYLNENIKLNKINKDRIQTFNADCRKVIKKLAGQGIKADRILMGLLPSPKAYLKDAKKISKKGTIIHYEAVSDNPKKLIKEIKDKFSHIRILKIVRVKSYGPRVWHFTIDIKL
jgi:tRNA wybutosine-synthesizing protein 2